MLQLKNLTLQFGDRYLFREASTDVRIRDRIGLVGPNGSGKTTLLRIINGDQSPDSGQVELASDATIGYLPQEGVVLRDRSLVEEMESAAGQIQDVQRRMEEAQEILKNHSPESVDYSEARRRRKAAPSRTDPPPAGRTHQSPGPPLPALAGTILTTL